MSRELDDLKAAVKAYDAIPKTAGTASFRIDAMMRVVVSARRVSELPSWCALCGDDSGIHMASCKNNLQKEF